MAELIDKFIRKVPGIALPLTLVLLPVVWIFSIIHALIEGWYQYHANGLVWCPLMRKYVTREERVENYRYHHGLDHEDEEDD